MAHIVENPNDGRAHVHALPGQRGSVPHREPRPAPCPEEGRITTLERRVGILETRDPPRDVITKEVRELPHDQIARIERLEREWSRVNGSQEITVPRAMTEMFEGLHAASERIQRLEERMNQQPVDITPADPNSVTITAEMLAEIREGIGDSISANAGAMSAMATLTRYLDSTRQRLSIVEDELIALKQHLEPRRRA